MTARPDDLRIDAVLRDLDAGATSTLTELERRRADDLLTRIVSTPVEHHRPARIERPRPSPRRRRMLVPVALLATAVVVASTALGGRNAFADWSAIPVTLPAPAAETAADTCRTAMAVPEQVDRIVVAERRGGWTYVLLDGSGAEAACLLPDRLIGVDAVSARRQGFFGSYDTDRPEAPTPPRDSIVETGSATGAVSVPGPLSVGPVNLGGTDGWFTWVSGYAGSDVTRVTVDPPVGPDVVASLEDGRFAAWWPAGRARGDNPDVGGAWSYTLTLADGTTRRI